MARVLRMPAVADDPAVATFTSWLVDESGAFGGAQRIATVETESSVVSVEVSEPGVLVKMLVEPGESVAPGRALAVLAAPGEVIDDVERLMVQLGLAVAPEAQSEDAHLHALPADDPLRATTWPLHLKEETEPVEAGADDETGADDAGPDEKWAAALVEAASSQALGEPVVVRRVEGWADAVATAVVTAVRGESEPVADVPAPRGQVRLREEVRARGLLSVVAQVETVSVLALVVKAVAVTSRRTPLTPGSPALTDVAVQHWTDAGTVAPVVHVASLMTASSLAVTLADLESRAQEGRLASGEPEPASVMVVDLGPEGVAEVAIDATEQHPAVLTIGAVRNAVVVEAGELVPGRVLTLSLCCDTSQVEAAAAARWFAHLVGLLEQPLRFLT
jgi:pyruvate dehydrogenase E2 component (dihydrolipoamide acetyltransferase)